MKQITGKQWLLTAILLAGLILRLWGIGFGLPFQFHQDEPIVINHAIAYGTGDLNPHFFVIPPLCSYILFIFYVIYFLAGKAVGIFAGAEDFAMNFFSDPSAFYLIARIILGIVPGILIVWLSYVLYKKLFGEKGAIYTAAVVSFSVLCVTNAHYAYVDNVMVLFMLMVYIFLVKMVERPSLKNYIVSGAIFGLAVATKYNGGLLIASCYTAHVIVVLKNGYHKRRLVFDRNLWVAALTSILIFVAANPFCILDWRFFLESVPGRIRAHPMGWTHHFRYSLVQGIGWALLIPSMIGLVLTFFKEKKEKAILLVSFPVIFYLHLVYKSQRFSRYGLPLMPFLAIGAAFLLFGVLLPKMRTKAQKTAMVLVSLLILVPTAAKSVKVDMLLSGEDTRVISAGWIEANIPLYTGIAADHTSFRPQVFQTKDQIIEKRKIAGYQEGLGGAKEKKIDFLLRVTEGRKTYNVFFLTDKNETRGQFLSTVPSVKYEIEDLKKNGISYVVMNYNTFIPGKQEFIDELNENADIVAEFSPYYDGKIRRRFDRVDTTGVSVGTKEIFSRKYSGPTLVVYKLRFDQ